MKKRKFFSFMLMGLLTVGATSMISSCKDYDDDINNLQEQIDKRALQDDVTALQTQLQNVSSTASSALSTAQTNATAISAAQSDIAAVKTTADNAAAGVADLVAAIATTNDNVATAQAAAEAAQKTADDAVAAAKAAQATADNAATKAALEAAAKAAQEYADSLAQISSTSIAEAVKAAQEATDKVNNAVTEAVAAQAKTDEDQNSKIEDALGRIATLETQVEQAGELSKKLSAIDSLINNSTTAEELKNLSSVVGNYKTSINELYSAVTSVELVASYSGISGNNIKISSSTTDNVTTYSAAIEPIDVTMTHGIIGETSTFGDEVKGYNASPIITFTKGNDIKDPKGILVRVNPVNADISKGTTIKLINSRGESLEDYVTVGTPTRYNGLITYTRASKVSTGLWTIPLSVASGVTEEEFNKAVVDPDNEDNAVLYAVAVKNTTDSVNADRYVVSTYDIATGYKAYKPANTFSFDVTGVNGKKNVSEIKNRWSKDGIVSETGETGGVDELAWKASTDDYPTPATSIAAENANVQKDTKDYRSDKATLQVEVGKPFSLKAFVGSNGDETKISLDHYYVILDKDNAVESAPSELNAWNSYDIDGLQKNVSADSTLNITIKSTSANGDIIGFRVYAVNRDGTLADPDGRAFYVAVGEVNSNALVGKLLADKAEAVSDTFDIKGLIRSGVTYGSWTIENKKDGEVFNITSPATETDAEFTAHYIDAKGNVSTNATTSAEKVYFTIDDVSKMFDSKTAELKLTGTRQIGSGSGAQTINVNTITASLTKTMPTGFPKSFAFRPMQETSEGSGKFIAYMIPYISKTGTEQYAIASSASSSDPVYATSGSKDLNNVFYGLDGNYQFVFGTSKKDGDSWVDTDPIKGKATSTTGVYSYQLDVPTSRIDNTAEHAVTASYLYKGVSTTKDAKGTVKAAQDYPVNYNKTLTAVYSCWHYASKYSWGEYTYKDGKNDKSISAQPELQWNATGTAPTGDAIKNANQNKNWTVSLEKILSSNSYNNDYFGLDLKTLISNSWLGLSTTNIVLNNTKTAVNAYLTYGSGATTQYDPYFSVKIENNNIVFSQESIQSDAAPTANHTETLHIVFKDAFGHTIDFTRPITILTANKAAKGK